MADARTLASRHWEYLDTFGEWVAFEHSPIKLAFGTVIGLPTGTPVALECMVTCGVAPHYYLAKNQWKTPVFLRNYDWETDSGQDDSMAADKPKEEGSSQTSTT
jgi:hypothetical protein